MVITLDIPDVVNRKLEADKRRTGLSKSFMVRQILIEHFSQKTKKVSE